MYELLRKVPLFAGLSDTDLTHLCQSVEEVRLSSTEELFAEGSPGDRAYVVKEGQVEVLKVSSGRDVLLAVYEPGAIIGEMALLEGTPRTASARTRTDTVLLAIGKDQFDQLLSISPSAAVIIRDNASRERVEEALRGMASFAEMNPAPVLRLDRHGTIVLVNPAARQLFGEPDLLGKSWCALCPELEPIALERVLESSDTLQCETQVGERCFLFTHRASLDRGQVYVYGADITARKRTEEALVGMASSAEMNPAPVLRLDRHGTIVLVNPAARQLFGEPDLLGKSWYALCPELEPIALERVLQSNDTLQCETQVGERCLLFTHRASLDRGQLYVYGADITARKRAEEALQESLLGNPSSTCTATCRKSAPALTAPWPARRLPQPWRCMD